MLFFFFKQKTAYEMRISDWSSDVCSSDLLTDDADALDALMSVRPAQEDGLMLKELLDAVGDLNRGQRETLLLVAGNGLSYEEASKVCGCPVGTIRSRQIGRAHV